jgi:hypothetical protein
VSATRSIRKFRFHDGVNGHNGRIFAIPDATAHDTAELVQSYSAKDYRMEIALDGMINVYKRQPTAPPVPTGDDRISSLSIDERTAQVREHYASLKNINERNADFWKRKDESQ